MIKSQRQINEYGPAREYLDHASSLTEQEQFGEAINKIAIAFDMIFKIMKVGKYCDMQVHHFTSNGMLVILTCLMTLKES